MQNVVWMVSLCKHDLSRFLSHFLSAGRSPVQHLEAYAMQTSALPPAAVLQAAATTAGPPPRQPHHHQQLHGWDYRIGPSIRAYRAMLMAVLRSSIEAVLILHTGGHSILTSPPFISTAVGPPGCSPPAPATCQSNGESHDEQMPRDDQAAQAVPEPSTPPYGQRQSCPHEPLRPPQGPRSRLRRARREDGRHRRALLSRPLPLA